jgi:pimeloyl-ACP methyl ester carboxylesterase
MAWKSAGRERGKAALIHGAMASSSTWWRMGPALAAAGWNTFAVDLPGHGTAPPLPGAFSMAAFAAETALRLPPQVDILVGHSLGAVVALTLAQRGEFTRALVLEDPPDSGPERLSQLARVIELDSALAKRDRSVLADRTRSSNPRWSAEDVFHAVDGIARADANGFLAALATQPLWDLSALVAAAGVPVCLLVDVSESLIPAHSVLREVVPADCFLEFSDGHCIHRARPDDWIRAVLGFAGRVLEPGAGSQ